MPNKTTDMRIHICIGRKSGHRTQNTRRGQMAAVSVIAFLMPIAVAAALFIRCWDLKWILLFSENIVQWDLTIELKIGIFETDGRSLQSFWMADGSGIIFPPRDIKRRL